MEDRFQIRSTKSILTTRELTVLTMKYQLGIPETEIGEAIGVSNRRVNFILRDSLAKLSRCPNLTIDFLDLENS